MKSVTVMSLQTKEFLQSFLNQGGLILFILIMMMVFFSLITPHFLNSENLLNILLQSSMIGLLALGATLVIISGGIDLSSGAMLAVSSIIVAKTQIYGIFVSSSLAILACIGLGFINGLLVSKGKVPPFITTLGMMGIAKGLALVLSNGQIISGITINFRKIASGSLFGVPTPVVIFILLAVLTWIYLNKSVGGYELFAVGGNYKAAKLSGIDVDRVLITVYVFAGFLAAVSGIVYTSRMTVGQPSAGDGYEMFAIAAAVIGGANLNGGAGNIFGTVIGVLILGVLSNFLNLASISPFIRDAIRGLLILGAVYYNWKQSNK